jgi:hypothetical protein
MSLVGSLRIGGNAPCLSCGHGETCHYSNVPLVDGERARILPEMFYRFEDDEKANRQAIELGKKLGDELRKISQ